MLTGPASNGMRPVVGGGIQGHGTGMQRTPLETRMGQKSRGRTGACASPIPGCCNLFPYNLTYCGIASPVGILSVREPLGGHRRWAREDERGAKLRAPYSPQASKGLVSHSRYPHGAELKKGGGVDRASGQDGERGLLCPAHDAGDDELPSRKAQG